MYWDSLSATLFQRFSHAARFKAAQGEFCRNIKNGAKALDFDTGDGRLCLYYFEK